jgi:hypothetical protein
MLPAENSVSPSPPPLQPPPAITPFTGPSKTITLTHKNIPILQRVRLFRSLKNEYLQSIFVSTNNELHLV